jgi:hypothetical protein
MLRAFHGRATIATYFTKEMKGSILIEINTSLNYIFNNGVTHLVVEMESLLIFVFIDNTKIYLIFNSILSK